jgi:hypothetical protein
MRADDHHLDACWMTWNSPETRLKVTTYPMMHIGDLGFYERISVDLERCRFALVEGVSWRLGDRRHPLWDLAAKNLGLAAQEKVLKVPPSTLKINLDMKRHEFRTHVFRLPLRYIAALVFLRPLTWLLTLPPAWRPAIRKAILRRRRYFESSNRSPLSRLLVGARDRRIVENLTAFYREHGRTEEAAFAAIVFGAGHMPAIAEGLRSLGFHVGTRRWVEAFRLPAGDGGHA